MVGDKAGRSPVEVSNSQITIWLVSSLVEYPPSSAESHIRASAETCLCRDALSEDGENSGQVSS